MPDQPSLTKYVHPRVDVLHRLDGPALKDRGEEQWFCMGNLHREDGPAFFEYVRDLQEWWWHGRRHRLDGPAVVVRDIPQAFWVDGRRVDVDEADRLALVALSEQAAVDPVRARELEMVLTMLQPGGASAADLVIAVRAAHA